MGNGCREIAELRHLALAQRIVLGFPKLGDVFIELPVESAHLVVNVLDLPRKCNGLIVGFGKFTVCSLELKELPLQQTTHELPVERNGTDHQCHQHANVELIIA